MHVRSKNFESSRPSISFGKVMKGGKIFEVENKFTDLVEGSRRELFEVNSYNKRTGIKINEVYHEGKWISVSDYQISNASYIYHENKEANEDKKPETKQNYSVFLLKKLLANFSGKKDYVEEKITNVESENSKETKNERLSDTEFQNSIIREMLSADKSKDRPKLMSEIKLKISNRVKEDSVVVDRETGRIRKENEIMGTLESGINGAYVFAREFLKNKKENESLFTSDILDAFYKVDYIKVINDAEGFISEVEFIQIKSNKELAEMEQNIVYEKHQAYLDSINVVISKEEFEKLREKELLRFYEERHKEGGGKILKKNIFFTKKFTSSSYFVDLKSRKENINLIKKEDLTINLK